MRLAALFALVLLAGCGASASAAPLAQATPARIYLPLVVVPPGPSEVIVRSSRSFTRSTTRYVAGEIQNNTASPVLGFTVTARFFDGAGQFVAADETHGLAGRVEPGQRAPFLAVLRHASASIAGYDLTVSTPTQPLLQFRPATVVSQEVREGDVLGELRNDTEAPLRGVLVAVTFYDAAGDVVNVISAYISSSDLAVGLTRGYAVRTIDEGLTYETYRVQAEGYVP